MKEDKVIVSFNKYHNQINELNILRDLALDLYFNNITIEKFKEEMNIANKKNNEWWWV